MATGKVLIYANDLDEKLCNMIRRICSGGGSREVADGACMALALLREAVPVDAVEVVHGRWEYGKWEQGHWVKGNERCRCSVCHRDFAVDNSNIWNGCPHCLAKMDGD